jgi:hypothetical protein
MKSAFGPASAHIVIVGGGIDGIATAKYLRIVNGDVKITVIEPDSRYVFCPGSNDVLVGDPIERFIRTYDPGGPQEDDRHHRGCRDHQGRRDQPDPHPTGPHPDPKDRPQPGQGLGGSESPRHDLPGPPGRIRHRRSCGLLRQDRYLASNQAKVVAQVIDDRLHGREPGQPLYANNCVAKGAREEFGMSGMVIVSSSTTERSIGG